MAYHRRLGADDGTVLCSCSICPFVGRYPTEIRYCNDGLFRCNVFCTERKTRIDYDNGARQAAKIRDEQAPRFKVGPDPGYYES